MKNLKVAGVRRSKEHISPYLLTFNSRSRSKHKKKDKKRKNDKKSKKKKHKRSSSASSSGSRRREKKDRRKKLKWVRTNLTVRVVSQKTHKGRLYNQKVLVQDIIGPEQISVLDTQGTLYEDLREKDLETVMPKIGEEVMVVKGKHKGTSGKLLERDKKKNKVRLMLNNTSFDIVELTQDDCCKRGNTN